MSLLRAIWRRLPEPAKVALRHRAARLALDAVHAAISFASDGVDSRIVLEAARQSVSPRAFLEGWTAIREWLGSKATAEDEALFEELAEVRRKDMN